MPPEGWTDRGPELLAQGLGMLMDYQNSLQLYGYKIDIENMTQSERIQFIKDMALALTDELHEMLGEVGWKPWATSDHIEGPAAMGEMVDVLHFFANICLALWWSDPSSGTEGQLGKWLAEHYLDKKKVNAKRQEDGYDGVSTKCRTCKRELTELPEDRIKEGWCICGTAFTVQQNADLQRKKNI